MISFFNWQTENKKNCFGPIRSLFSFSTAQTEKFVEKIGKNKIRCLVVVPMSSLLKKAS